jgi:hypothetical protein
MMKRPASFSRKSAAGYLPRLRLLKVVCAVTLVIGILCAASNLYTYFDGHVSITRALAPPLFTIVSSLLLRFACVRLIRLFESFSVAPDS